MVSGGEWESGVWKPVSSQLSTGRPKGGAGVSMDRRLRVNLRARVIGAGNVPGDVCGGEGGGDLGDHFGIGRALLYDLYAV